MNKENVNLKDFIARVIEDVYVGVNEGKNKIHEVESLGSESTNINFDLAVTTTTDKVSNTNGQIAVSVLNFVNLQAKGQSGKGAIVSQANRIQFTIPLTLRVEKKRNPSITVYGSLDQESEY